MADRIADLQYLRRINQLRFLVFLYWLRFIDQPRLIPLKATLAVGVFMPLLLLVK